MGRIAAINRLATVPYPATLRNIIWGRLIASLTSGGVLQRTIEWSLLLNQVPVWLGGGAGALLERTKIEWTILKGHIDAGRPWPIGLVYTGRNLWDQHQILAYGYQDFGNRRGRLLVYDNNAPHQYGDSGHSQITLNFSGPALVATTPSDGAADMLAGFFCSNYIPAPPPTNLAAGFGQFVSWTTDPRTWVTPYGVRMPVVNPSELTSLGGAPTDVRSTATPFAQGVIRPRDGALLREHTSAPVFLYQGGAPFFIPDPTWLNRFGGFGPVRLAPAGALAAFAGPPDEGTLLREWSDPKVYRIMNGQRCWVTTPVELMKFGSFTDVRLVPDGALAAIPLGPMLPQAEPGECESLKEDQVRLAAEILQLQENLAEAPNRRAEARIRASIVRAQTSKARAGSRAQALQCP